MSFVTPSPSPWLSRLKDPRSTPGSFQTSALRGRVSFIENVNNEASFECTDKFICRLLDGVDRRLQEEGDRKLKELTVMQDELERKLQCIEKVRPEMLLQLQQIEEHAKQDADRFAM